VIIGHGAGGKNEEKECKVKIVDVNSEGLDSSECIRDERVNKEANI
jgi:hypothetical protein